MGEAAANRSACPLQGLTALVVEDHPDSRDALRQVLASAGAEVIEVEDGHRALQVLAATRIDVVLCDLRMPHVDGFEFMRRFRGGWPRTPAPVIAVTALGDGLAVLRETRAAGFDAHLAKPFDFDALIGAVARVTGRPSPAESTSPPRRASRRRR
ncbi:MAG TPA: response regulator [Methylomirabilota bacterium]|jgi:hypothetical protein|nr:response regulator [Methylomirabilota bacterium]